MQLLMRGFAVGADLVLVKMTKDTSTASSAADGKASGANAAGGGSSDGGTAPEDAQASVLAQHELTKVRLVQLVQVCSQTAHSNRRWWCRVLLHSASATGAPHRLSHDFVLAHMTAAFLQAYEAS